MTENRTKTPIPRNLTHEQIRAELNAATIGAYDRNRGITSPAQMDPEKNFEDLAEMTGFLETCCKTCATKPPRGACSDYEVLKGHETTCKTDAGRCIYAFPSRGFHRKDGIVECKHYALADSP